MTFAAAGTLASNAATGLTTLAHTNNTTGNCLILGVKVSSTTITVTSVTGGGATGWIRIGGPGNDGTRSQELWLGTVTATGSQTVTVNFSASVSAVAVDLDAQEFSSSLGSGAVWTGDAGGFSNNTATSTTITYPVLAPALSATELYVGQARVPGGGTYSGLTAGFTSQTDVNMNPFIYGLAVTASVSPVQTASVSTPTAAVGALVTDSPPVAGPAAVMIPQRQRLTFRGPRRFRQQLIPVAFSPYIPPPMTVTATQGGATGAGMLLRVRVLTNAAATQNGAVNTQTGAGSHQAAITTTQAGSRPYCAMCLGAAGPMTAATGTTLDDNYQDATNTQCYATGHATAATGTPGAVTIGSSLPNGNGGGAAVAEILQASSGTLGDDGTAPPVATTNTATTLTTATFTPNPGTLLLAMIGTHWGSGVQTFTVTDSTGLTWTPLAQANGSNQGYAGLWIAQVPGVQPPSLSVNAGLATATGTVPTPSTSIQNVTVNFTSVITATSALGIGYTISTYHGGGSANINSSATWKNSLAALGATHCRIPLRWNAGSPGSGAGGAQTSGDADTYIANIKAIGAIPLIVFSGDTSDNGFVAADGASFVHHYNDSGGQNNGPVHYWVIGNEPDNTGGTGPYESALPGVLTAMHGADATVKLFAPAAAYWDTALLSGVASMAQDGMDYHAYDGSNTDGTGFPTSPQYYTHVKTDLPAYKAGILYAVTEANWHSGYSSLPDFYTWRNTCFIADAAGQVLAAGGSFSQYSDSGGGLSLMNDGAATDNQPGSFGTTFPAYMGLGIWTGMAGSFKGLSANMVSAVTSFAQGQLSVFGCDNGKIVAVNKEQASKTLTIGVTLPGGATSGTYNVWASNYASPLSALTEVVTAAAFTGSTISYVIPAGTAVSIDVSTNVSAGLATATGSAGTPGTGLAAGLAMATGTAQPPTVQTPGLTSSAALATATATAGQPGTGLTPALPLCTATAFAAGTGTRTAGAATGTGAAYGPVTGAAIAAGLATATGDSPPSVASDGSVVVAWLATGTGTAQSPAPLATVPAGLASGTGSARSPGAGGWTAGTATGTGSAPGAAAGIAPAAVLAAGTGTAWPAVASAGATVLAQLATGTGSAGSPAAGVAVPDQVATATGTALAAGPLLAPAAVLAAGTGTAQPPSVSVTPKITALTDTFPGTTLNGSLWTAFGTGTAVVGGGVLTLTDVASSTAQAGIGSNSVYDLTNGAVSAQLVSAGTQYATTQATLIVQPGSDYNDRAEILAGGGSLIAQHAIAGSYSTVASAAYSATAMRFLRLRETAGTLYYEYSADGDTWTTLASEANPITLTAVSVIIQHSQYGGTDPQSSSQWDNVNVPVAGLAAGTGTAQSPVTALAVTARLATGTGTAPSPVASASAAVTAGLATATGSAPGASVSGGTVTSPALTVSGFGTFPQVPAGSAISAVIANITWHGSDAQVTAPSYELWDGTTAIIGSAQHGTAATADHADSVIFTGAAWSQLATLQLRIYATSQVGNSGAVAAFDAASLSVQWSPSQDVTDLRPAALAVVPAFPAVTVEQDMTASPGTLAVTPAFPAPAAGTASASTSPGTLAASTAFPAPAASASTQAAPGLLAVTPAFPAPAAGLLNAAVTPGTLTAATAFPVPAVAVDVTASPAALAVVPALPAVFAGQNAVVASGTLAAATAVPPPGVSGVVNAAVTPGVLAVIPAFPAIINATAPGWAAAASGAGWSNPASAEGTPDGSYATWTF